MCAMCKQSFSRKNSSPISFSRTSSQKFYLSLHNRVRREPPPSTILGQTLDISFLEVSALPNCRSHSLYCGFIILSTLISRNWHIERALPLKEFMQYSHLQVHASATPTLQNLVIVCSSSAWLHLHSGLISTSPKSTPMSHNLDCNCIGLSGTTSLFSLRKEGVSQLLLVWSHAYLQIQEQLSSPASRSPMDDYLTC